MQLLIRSERQWNCRWMDQWVMLPFCQRYINKRANTMPCTRTMKMKWYKISYFFVGVQLEHSNKGAVINVDNMQELVSYLHIFSLAKDNALQVVIFALFRFGTNNSSWWNIFLLFLSSCLQLYGVLQTFLALATSLPQEIESERGWPKVELFTDMILQFMKQCSANFFKCFNCLLGLWELYYRSCWSPLSTM